MGRLLLSERKLNPVRYGVICEMSLLNAARGDVSNGC